MVVDWAAPQWSLLANCIVLVILAAFDKFFSSNRARWFSVHAFANLLVVLTGIRPTIATLLDPLDAMDDRVYNDSSIFGTASPWPTIITNSVHVYHMLAFKLTGSDYFHHLMFIPTVGFMGQYYRPGAVRGFLGMMLSGLPGGLDYLNLVLVRHGRLDGLTQKRYCAAINIWLRGPSLVISFFIMYQACLYGRCTMPYFVAATVAILAGFNGQYYTKQAVANFAISHSLGHVHERISVTTGMAVPDWKKIVGSKVVKEPQSTIS